MQCAARPVIVEDCRLSMDTSDTMKLLQEESVGRVVNNGCWALVDSVFQSQGPGHERCEVWHVHSRALSVSQWTPCCGSSLGSSLTSGPPEAAGLLRSVVSMWTRRSPCGRVLWGCVSDALVLKTTGENPALAVGMRHHKELAGTASFSLLLHPLRQWDIRPPLVSVLPPRWLVVDSLTHLFKKTTTTQSGANSNDMFNKMAEMKA